ncbi:MAG: carbohydrate binding domain-containing protein, partial [Armatimonadota bacterium]|nr:carbohydrate binding domain-containing protein [Armatimonadota bacterium]
NVTKVDPTSWHVQLHQAGLNFKEGETYSLRFRARADSKRSMSVSSGLDQADWHHTGLDASAQLTGTWKTFQYLFTAHDTVPDHGRLAFILGTRVGTVWLADVSLRHGLIEPPILPGQSPAMHNIPIPPTPFLQQRADWLQFLEDTERNFAVDMRNYLKDDLHFKPMVICSQVSYGGLAGDYREAPMDFVDNHSYWQHPSFPGRPWDAVNWNIGNTSMTLALGKGDELIRLARERVAGKPYTVSEYNHPAPSEYQSETVPLLASFAAFQDWDALYLFDYGGYGAGAANDKIQGFFAVNSNPAKWAFVPAAAMIFRAGETVSPSATNELDVSSGLDIDHYSSASDIYRLLGATAPDPFSSRIGFAPRDGANLQITAQPTLIHPAMNQSPPGASAVQPSASNLAASSHLTVTNADPKTAHYTANGTGAKVIVGFVGGQTVTLGEATFTFGEMPNNFAALTLTAQDQKPLAASNRMLLTVADRVENTGMVWNAAHTSVGDQWGTGPTVADGVPVDVSLRTAELLSVFALDATGKRDHRIIATYEAGGLHFKVGPEDKTLWYAVVKE